MIGRVQQVVPGAQQFQVTDPSGDRIQVVSPARAHGVIDFYRDGNRVNTSALHEGDTVLVTGVGHGNWFEANRAEILTGERAGGATAEAPVLRFKGFVSGRELRAVSADGTEYRVVFPPRPQEIDFWKAGSLANLSALREGDLMVVRGLVLDHTVRTERVEVLDESRMGRGAPMPLRLTYRGSAGWRELVGEAADGARYTVQLPRRTQALYFVQGGRWVETSTLHPGQAIEVAGTIRGDTVEANRVTLR
jgi:hypothetical protein